MKKFLIVTAVIVGFILLMVLPGFVLFIVGSIGNELIADKKKKEP